MSADSNSQSQISLQDISANNAAMSPMLDATAAILPLLAQISKPRFDPKINSQWKVVCKDFYQLWKDRKINDAQSLENLHNCVWKIYQLTLKTKDDVCLPFGEALLSAFDRFETIDEENNRNALPLITALSAVAEMLCDPQGLEHTQLDNRFNYFCERLKNATICNNYNGRSEQIDKMFQNEAFEHLDLMEEALISLPPDINTLQESADWLVQEAEQIELSMVAQQARSIEVKINALAENLDDELARLEVVESLPILSQVIQNQFSSYGK